MDSLPKAKAPVAAKEGPQVVPPPFIQAGAKAPMPAAAKAPMPATAKAPDQALPKAPPGNKGAPLSKATGPVLTGAEVSSWLQEAAAASQLASQAATPKAAPMKDKTERRQRGRLTLSDVMSGRFPALKEQLIFDPALVVEVYAALRKDDFPHKKVNQLECNSYLERYLWPFYELETSSSAHLMSIICIVNEKLRESIPAWESLAMHKEKFAGFYEKVLDLWENGDLNMRERAMYLQFMINCFQSLEQEFVRDCCLKLTGLQAWFHLNPLHREKLLKGNKKLPAFWKKVQKKYADPKTTFAKHEKNFTAGLIEGILRSLEGMGEKESLDTNELAYVERGIELMIDLLNQLPTRRFFRPLLLDKHFVVRCRLSKLAQKPQGRLFNQLLDILRFYENFEIDDTTGQPLTRLELTENHYEKYQLLQRVCFAEHEDLKQLAMTNISALDTKESLMKYLEPLSREVLKDLCAKVCFLNVESDPILSEVEKVANAAQEAAEAALEEQENDPENPKKKKKKKKRKVKTPEETRFRELLIEIIIMRLERPVAQLEQIEKMPLYPTEEICFDPNLIPEEHFQGDYSLALPKLNLQFLTIYDYLLRNFNLFRLECTYEVREDIADMIPRMRARKDGDGVTTFSGKARMALPLDGVDIMVVKKPKVGETVPAEVRAELRINLTGVLPNVRTEWDELREHDSLFLLEILAPDEIFEGHPKDVAVEDFPSTFGLMRLRGAEIIEVLDEEGNNVTDPNPMERKTAVGDNRIIRVFLDEAQYHKDLDVVARGGVEVYERLNLIMRRKPKENNFKAILNTIRSLMTSEHTTVPDWLHDLFLGYGDPGSAQYWKLNQGAEQEIDFRDTFLDQDHILESFPDADDIDIPEELKKPFRLKFTPVGDSTEKNKKPAEAIQASAYTLPNMGPYPECVPNQNMVRFTPVQVEAIRAGVSPGLTMVVGPPGTGKTDTAVQVVNLLFHNYPDQKIVLIAHSNQALNDLFEKCVKLDIPERYLLRLGRGIEELDIQQDFSKWGRVNHMLQRRLDLLEKVERLADSLGVAGADAAYTCENAQHFFLQHVMYRWEEYKMKLETAGKDAAGLPQVLARLKRKDKKEGSRAAKRRKLGEEAEEGQEEPKAKRIKVRDVDGDEVDLEELGEPETKIGAEEENRGFRHLHEGKGTVVSVVFPFHEFFNDAPQPLFPQGNSYEDDLEIAEGCFRYLKNVFLEIEECHAFELLRSGRDRGNYLITTHARIIAMTCTHAALKRGDLVNLNFKYDNLIMEESAQILEVETFIPMLLQQSERGVSRLKRVMLIGDHHQLPPVVKNRAFQKYGHLDQSLYARFVRLKTPTVDLNLQGRGRPSIAKLYNWRYKELGNLPNVLTEMKYKLSNPGMTHEYQWINCEDHEGQGETSPNPYFYQNLGEAEYVVALFMYMRLIGYPAAKITILTPYNGQKALLKDVVRQRCAWNPLFGEPAKITTVDKYQGQQNDYILISLVRTKAVGHIRDVRRLVVAMSRSRYGLYVFGKLSVFENCFELAPVLNLFIQRPLDLCLEPHEDLESGGTTVGEDRVPSLRVTDLKQMWSVLQNQMQNQFKGLQTSQGAPASGGKKKEAVPGL